MPGHQATHTAAADLSEVHALSLTVIKTQSNTWFVKQLTLLLQILARCKLSIFQSS